MFSFLSDCQFKLAHLIPWRYTPISRHGTPYMAQYGSEIYGESGQNWAIVQDDRGIMYFANTSGVLEFDGLSWRIIPIPNKSPVRSLFKASDGIIYAGAQGEFGYLTADSSGTGHLVYRSLVSLIPENERDFEAVWNIYGKGDLLIVQSYDKIFLIDRVSNSVDVIKPQSSFHQSFWVNGDLYVREWGVGLQKLSNTKLELVQGGEQFSDERLYVMIDFNGKENLLISRTKGLFLMDENHITPWDVPASNFFKEHPVYVNPVVFNNPAIQELYGSFAVGTLSAGIALIDKNGNITKVFNEANGLISNQVLSLYLDKQNHL